MLIAKKLGTISRGLFASPVYLAKNGKSESLAQLPAHHLLIII